MSHFRLAHLLHLSLPLAAALSCFGGLSIGSLRHTGAIWLATLVVGIQLLVAQAMLRGTSRITFPWLWWIPFYCYYFFTLLWSGVQLRNVQLGIQMLTFLVVGMVISFAVEKKEDLKSFNKLYLGTTLVIGLFCLYFMHGPGLNIQHQDNKGLYVGFAERPAGTTLTIVGAIFLAQIRRIPLVAVSVWLLTLILSILTGGRMATFVLIALWIVHPRLARLTTKAFIVFFTILTTLVAFNTPIIQERFFEQKTGFSGKGSVDDVMQGKFHSSGRFEAWPKILKRAHRAPLLGHGLGSSAPYVYKVWTPMDKPHNEYLKMYFEGGYVGLSLFLLAITGTWLNIRRVLRQSKAEDDNWPASAAYMGLFAFVTMAAVDNPLVYGNNFMHPLFALVGAANALLAIEKKERAKEEKAEKSESTEKPDT